ncbi:RNA-binding domain-containing protein [Membranihabitans maritimus]|uniref:RNA-binding domain-containing protein n=1 Tax=Membranihabitans maritimus TaxID=2904244 RepID=UPI001F287C75|nr:RNA-binding domain-containing protein [Membranihabitans maritimus]
MESILDTLLSVSVENEVVEFKKARNQFNKDKLGKYFSALSNEANLLGKSHAWLVFGVADDRSIIGTEITDNQLNDYKTEIAQHTSPRTNFTNINQVIKNGNKVLLFEIPAAPQGMPVSWKGFNYGRDGESLGPLNNDEYMTIRKQANQQDWSARVIPNANIDDLSKEAIRQARIRFAQKNPKLKKQIKEWSDRVFLNKAKITIKGKVTPTAILLLGKPESEHFITPSTSKISWILKDNFNIEKDYEHFFCPLLINVEKLYNKIRNLKYRYIKDGSLFPDEVDQYDPYIIREALNNCIAHQDYTLGGKILVVESENASLTFSNAGSFIPQSVEYVIKADAPESTYRNKFLSDAMVNLNMIDTIGSGIKRMFNIQRHKFFPLPEYDLSNNKVQVTIIGKILDINYARKLAQMPELILDEIILLDKVAKKKELTKNEIKILRSKKLVEGRKPNFHISSKVALATNEKGEYIKWKGFDENYYKDLIVKYLEEFGKARKSDFKKLLMNKLPAVLDENQKEHKIKNLLQKMKNEKLITINKSRYWVLDEI